MRKPWLAALALTLALTSPVLADDNKLTRATLGGLRGVHVKVERINIEAEREGLGPSVLQTDVELRLRQSHIRVLTQAEQLKAPGAPYLYLRVAAPELGYIEEMFGSWNVKYPGPDGMIEQGYVERLDLRRDGTYYRDPLPAWASKTGRWGVVRTPDGTLRLCFEEKQGGLRCNYLVLIQVEKGGPFFLNWQRTHGKAVIFKDRIFFADRPKDWFPTR